MSELMPNLDGITSYFDISSVDLTNNKWCNRISVGNDILLPNGGNIQNNALYLSSSQYGKLQITEHRTIYCVFKTLEEKNTWSPIISKGLTSGSTSYTGFWLSLDPSGNVIAFYTTNGAVTSAIRGMEYHVACITRDDNNVGYFYLDGVLIGTTTSKSGNYQGYYYLNRLYRSGGFSDTPVNTEFQVCAFGTAYHDANIVKTNTVFLSTGYAPKDLRLAGTDAVAIAYAIARNQESAAALQQINRAYQEGIVNGNGDTIIPYETDEPEPGFEPTINDDPEKSDNTGTAGDTVININDGVWLTYTDSNDNITCYVHVWVENFTYEDNKFYQRDRYRCEVYNADGTVKHEFVPRDPPLGSVLYYCENPINPFLISRSLRIYLKNNKYIYEDRYGIYPDSGNENYGSYNRFSLGSYISGSYKVCTNVKPF